MAPLAMKAEAEVSAERREIFISWRRSKLRKLRKVGNGVRRGAMSATLSKRPFCPLMASSELDRGADFTEGIDRCLMELEIVSDGAILLFDLAEFLSEVNLAGLLVVVEEAMARHADRVRGGGGGVGRHDEVDDIHAKDP
jgi:hypothetical protein